jgi:hypothetical protein
MKLNQDRTQKWLCNLIILWYSSSTYYLNVWNLGSYLSWKELTVINVQIDSYDESLNDCNMLLKQMKLNQDRTQKWLCNLIISWYLSSTNYSNAWNLGSYLSWEELIVVIMQSDSSDECDTLQILLLKQMKLNQDRTQKWLCNLIISWYLSSTNYSNAWNLGSYLSWE